MKKISVMLALLGSALGVMGSAHAANGGTLNFTGALTNTSCEVSSGGGSADNIPVDLGRVSFADIGNRTESRLGTAKDIDLLVTCLQPAAESTVHMSFRPAQVDPGDPYLLPTAGAAKGVGIGLVRRDSDNFLNMGPQRHHRRHPPAQWHRFQRYLVAARVVREERRLHGAGCGHGDGAVRTDLQLSHCPERSCKAPFPSRWIATCAS